MTIHEITPGSVPNPTPGCVSFAMANRAPRIPEHQLDPRIEPRRFEDQALREFDPHLGVWQRLSPAPQPRPIPRYQSAVPESDGSGVWWVAYEWDHAKKRMGQPIWTYQAGDFDRALAEKVRLCHLAGYRPGQVRLREFTI